MKVNGKQLNGPRIVKIYLPTGDSEAVEFRFRPLKADEDFEKVMSSPQAPEVMKPGGVRFQNINDPAYKRNLSDWMAKKFDWEFLMSISVTEDLEWEKVKMDEPDTWKLWKEEIGEHFGDNQTNKIFSGFIEAQFITEESMEAARKTFLTGRQLPPEQSTSPTGEPIGTPPG